MKRFWGILAIVASLSRRARKIPLRSRLSSVTPALSIATSVPEPIAIPTSTAASAGASFTTSPAIDRKSVEAGKCVSGRVDQGGRGTTKQNTYTITHNYHKYNNLNHNNI